MKEFDAEALRDLNQRMLRASRLRIFSVLFFAAAAWGGYLYLQHQESEAKAGIRVRQVKVTQDSAKIATLEAKVRQEYGPRLDSVFLRDSIRHFVNAYLACREKHDPRLLDAYHSDTLRRYFLYEDISKTYARRLGADYWEKNPGDRFEPQSEPVLLYDSTHFTALVKGRQCRQPGHCHPEILEIHVRRGGPRLMIDYVRAYYADKAADRVR